MSKKQYSEVSGDHEVFVKVTELTVDEEKPRRSSSTLLVGFSAEKRLLGDAKKSFGQCSKHQNGLKRS